MNFERFEAAIFKMHFLFIALLRAMFLPGFGDLFWAWSREKVNGVEKCVLKARPLRERERKKNRAESAMKILRLSIMAALSVTLR